MGLFTPREPTGMIDRSAPGDPDDFRTSPEEYRPVDHPTLAPVFDFEALREEIRREVDAQVAGLDEGTGYLLDPWLARREEALIDQVRKRTHGQRVAASRLHQEAERNFAAVSQKVRTARQERARIQQQHDGAFAILTGETVAEPVAGDDQVLPTLPMPDSKDLPPIA